MPFTSSLMLGAAAAAICGWATGLTLGFYFGGIMLSALIVPPLVSAETSWRAQLSAVGGTVAGIAIFWFIAGPLSHDPGQPMPGFVDIFACILILLGFDLFLAGMTAAFVRVTSSPSLATFAAVVLALAWSTWPVWLGGVVLGHDDIVYSLTCWHPLAAVNGVLKEITGFWTQQALAYRLTALAHELPLPRGIAAAVLGHAGLGAAMMMFAHARKRTAGASASG